MNQARDEKPIEGPELPDFWAWWGNQDPTGFNSPEEIARAAYLEACSKTIPLSAVANALGMAEHGQEVLTQADLIEAARDLRARNEMFESHLLDMIIDDSDRLRAAVQSYVEEVQKERTRKMVGATEVLRIARWTIQAVTVLGSAAILAYFVIELMKLAKS